MFVPDSADLHTHFLKCKPDHVIPIHWFPISLRTSEAYSSYQDLEATHQLAPVCVTNLTSTYSFSHLLLATQTCEGRPDVTMPALPFLLCHQNSVFFFSDTTQ